MPSASRKSNVEGRNRIVLIEPGMKVQDEYGDVSSTPIKHRLSALRTDRGGRRGVEADTTVGEWEREYEVRNAGLSDISTRWFLQDTEDGDRVFAIESIRRFASNARKLILRVKSQA